MRSLWISIIALVDCAQQARLPTSYFAETATALAPGHASVTVAGGAGVVAIAGDLHGVGGGARVRVGVGDGQEVGVELAAAELNVGANNCFHNCDDLGWTAERLRAFGAQVAWKDQLSPRTAVIVDAGVTHHEALSPAPVGDAAGTSVTGAAALVGSRPLRRSLTGYGGCRLAAAVPVARSGSNAATAVEMIAAVGVELATTVTTRLDFEVYGALAANYQVNYVPMLLAGAVVALRWAQ